MTKLSFSTGSESRAPLFTGLIDAVTPSLGQVWDRTKAIAPPALAIGAGGVSLVQLLKMFRDQREMEAAAKPRKDVLTVEIDPQQKQAGLQDIIDYAKRPFIASAQQQVKSPEKTPHLLSENAMQVAIAIGALGAGSAAASSFFEGRRKKDLEDRLERAKSEYSSILGKSLVGGTAGVKTAEVEVYCEACPTIAGFCDSIARSTFPEDQQKTANGNPLMEVISAPMTLLTLSGILSHKWLYNRLKDQEKAQTTSMPSPPREIRLVTKPQPTTQMPQPNESDVVTPEEEDPRKAAGALDGVLDGMGLNLPDPAGDAARSAVQVVAPAGQAAPAPEPEKNSVAPVRMVDVGPGTMAAETSGGPVTIEAEDENAARVLQQNRGRLKKVLSVLQAQSIPA